MNRVLACACLWIGGCGSATPAGPTPTASSGAATGEEAAPTAETEEAPATPAEAHRHVEQRVTVVNPTTHAIRVTLASTSPDIPSAAADIAEIAAGATGSSVIPVCDHGSLVVTAHWNAADGSPVEGRPFTVAYNAEAPITPVSMTLSIPTPSARMGVWTAVLWEGPPAQ